MRFLEISYDYVFLWHDAPIFVNLSLEKFVRSIPFLVIESNNLQRTDQHNIRGGVPYDTSKTVTQKGILHVMAKVVYIFQNFEFCKIFAITYWKYYR